MPGRTGFHKSPHLPTTSLASLVTERLRPKMKLVGMVCVGVLILSGSAAAQDGGKTISNTTISKTTISLGTATPGGGFPLYGNAFAEIMNAADPTLSIEPLNTK